MRRHILAAGLGLFAPAAQATNEPTRVYTEDAEYYLGYAPIRIVTKKDGVAASWKPFVNFNETDLKSQISTELSGLSGLMPKACAILINTVKEAFLVENKESEPVRVLNQFERADKEFYSYFSYLPVSARARTESMSLFFRHAPESLSNIYANHFDGLFDASLAGGPLPLREMRPLSQTIDDFMDFPWHASFKQNNNTQDIVLIFASGGGGYLYLDLNKNQIGSKNPECILMTNDRDDRVEHVALWEYLDAWTAIAMGG